MAVRVQINVLVQLSSGKLINGMNGKTERKVYLSLLNTVNVQLYVFPFLIVSLTYFKFVFLYVIKVLFIIVMNLNGSTHVL
jgi:hypothetical protein